MGAADARCRVFKWRECRTILRRARSMRWGVIKAVQPGSQL